MKCKHCGREIVKIKIREDVPLLKKDLYYVHEDSGYVQCNSRAEPEENDS